MAGGLAIVDYLRSDQRSSIVPFGLHCILSEVRRRGFDAALVNAPDDLHAALRRWTARGRAPDDAELAALRRRPAMRAFLEALAGAAPALVGFTAYESHLDTVELLLRLVRPAVDAYTIIGGPLPTALGARALDLVGADIAFLGEAERRLPDLLERLRGRRPSSHPAAAVARGFEDAPWLAFRGERRPDGFHRVERLGDAELAAFAPDWAWAIDHLDRTYDEYRDYPILSYISSRGCPMGCVFCSSIMGKRFRALPPERVVQDLEAIRDIARVRFRPREKFIVAFGDDNFLFDRDRALRIFRSIRRRGLDGFFRFTFQASVNTFFRDLRAERLDDELMRNLARLNVKYVTLGTDNFCDAELRTLRKAPYTKRHIVALVEAFERLGTHNNHYCILSNLHTRPEHIVENLETIRGLDRRFRRFIQLRPIMHLTPYYGTPAWREAVADPRARRRMEPYPTLFRRPPRDVRLGKRLLPLDARARRMVDALDRDVPTRRVKSVPYYYDLDAACALAARLASAPA